MDDIRRGEIFYIARGGATNGSEQFADRPAVVVSNDENNKHSGVIEVVYMTTQPKTDLPTHVTVRSTGRLSTVLCEQVSSVSTDRVNNYIGQVSEQEMKNIDIVKIICKELGKPESLITYVTDRKGHDMRYAIDPTKIHNELGWLPETKFADGIKKTIQWYLDNKEWWETIISGEYQNYYEKMYGNR